MKKITQSVEHWSTVGGKGNLAIFNRGVPKWVFAMHCVFAQWLKDSYPVRHYILTDLMNRASVSRKEHYVGTFSASSYRKCCPNITLACKTPSIKGLDRYTQHSFKVYELLNTFAHEFVHYEQWRDKKPMTHRGVENRVLAILKKFNKYAVENGYIR